MNIRLDGKTAVVTGAARGIGLAIASAMHESGAAVALADLDLPAARDSAGALGERSHAFAVDVGDVGSCRDLVNSVIEQLGQIDILVNNAGICPLMPLEEVDHHFFDRMVAINLRGAYFLSQAAAKHMRARQTGRIINVSSVGGKTGGYLDISVYALTKAGLYAVTKSFAKYLAPHGTVNTIAPGPTETDLTANWNAPDMVEKLRETVPLARLGLPQDYAGAAVFLASEQASFITGATLDINGGIRMD